MISPRIPSGHEDSQAPSFWLLPYIDWDAGVDMDTDLDEATDMDTNADIDIGIAIGIDDSYRLGYRLNMIVNRCALDHEIRNLTEVLTTQTEMTQYIHIYIYMYVYVCTYVCMYVYIHKLIGMCIHIYIYKYKYKYMYMDVYIITYMLMFICTHVHKSCTHTCSQCLQKSRRLQGPTRCSGLSAVEKRGYGRSWYTGCLRQKASVSVRGIV